MKGKGVARGKNFHFIGIALQFRIECESKEEFSFEFNCEFNFHALPRFKITKSFEKRIIYIMILTSSYNTFNEV